jgi:PKD domain-containing protein
MRNIVLMVIISLIISVGFTGIASTILQASGRVSISDLVADRPSVWPGGNVQVHAEAKDSAGGAVSYVWKADGGHITGKATDTVTWTAPPEEGRYHISITVSNAGGSKAEASADIIVSKYSRSGTS